MVEMNKKKSMDDETDLREMAEFYGKEHSEVYFINDLEAGCVVGVLCYPAKTGMPMVNIKNRRLNMFGYKNRLLSFRVRYDKNEYGDKMLGFESLVGKEYHDTRVGEIENGIVVKKVILDSGAVRYDNIAGRSSYEIAKAEKEIEILQGKSEKKSDYEIFVNSKGNKVERFETFALERVK